jgi:hypothetical protein
MPLPVRAALLAVAALAALAFAAVRITSAADHRTTEQESPKREVTAPQAAATLAKLQAPPGFREIAPCRFPQQYQKCFWTPHALDVDVPEAERIAAAQHTRAVGIPLISGCHGSLHPKGGIVLRACAWNLEIGPELLAVFTNTLSMPPGPPRTRKARKALRYWRRGTEIQMVVIGHWPHGKEPREPASR